VKYKKVRILLFKHYYFR